MAGAVGKRLTVQMRDDNSKARELISYTHRPFSLRTRMQRLGVDDAWVAAYRYHQEIDGGPLGSIALGSNFGGTLLHLLLYGQNARWKMRMLIQMGIPVNEQDDNGCTVLHAACEAVDPGETEHEIFNEGMDHTVRLLIKAGACMNARDRWGRLPAELAFQNKSPGASRYFVELLENLTPIWNIELLRRCRNEGESFAMGYHERLGDDSLVRLLDPNVIKVILGFAGKLDGAE